MLRYKVYFDNRVITLSHEPDRVQKYALFHKFGAKEELFDQISEFAVNINIPSLNIYSSDINNLWSVFSSWFTVIEAAGGLVEHPSGKYLFIMRYGRWDLPKGHFEEGETPEQCALREVTEECNIRGHNIMGALPPSYHTYLFDSRPYMKKTWWFHMSYSGEMITEPQAEEGITHAEWLEPKEIARIKDNTFQSLLDLLNYTLRVR
ncbi:MAG: NUDIX domain-containing protein [Bacteroidales bacterium]|nr:NUDIX domain-containing protein [Bacteroidales bacterium]MDT8374522.1 NUDIX domain-containing protein [Bacteroidales bacterium]